MKPTLFTFLICLAGSAIQAQSFSWAKQYKGDSSFTISKSLAVDASGNIYTSGYFTDTVDFDPGTKVYNLISDGDLDIFITKTDAAGNFIWALRMGGTGTDGALGMVLDASGNIYTTGAFSDTVDFDPGTGINDLTASGKYDMFILKLNASGKFIWAKQISGSDEEIAFSIAIDASNNVYTTGNFLATVDFDPGLATNNITAVGYADIFVLKVDASGNFAWVGHFEGSNGTNFSSGNSIKVDVSKNVYTSGVFAEDVDFDPGSSKYILSTTVGDDDIFISKLDSNGKFAWARQIGGTDYDGANSLALDASANIHIAGYFGGTVDFDPGSGTANLVATGFQDAFVSKYDKSGNYVWAKSFSGDGYKASNSISLDAAGNVYTAGAFEDSADFDPGTGSYILNAIGNSDVFVSKLSSTGNFVWAALLGGTGGGGAGSYADCGSITTDKSSNVYVSGYFEGDIDLDPGINTFILTSNGGTDGFICKLGQCQSTSFGITITSCSTYVLNSQTYSNSGVYTQLVKNVAGCDSTITLRLTILKPSSSIIASECNSYTLNSQTYNKSGVYKQTVKNAKGCDSTITLTLTIKKTADTLTVNACSSYTLNSQTYTNTGVFIQTLTNKAGCDSILTLDLTISSKATSATINPVACNVYVLNTKTYNSSGVYTQTLKNKAGCDSTLTINLTVNKSTTNSITTTACRSYRLNSQLYNNSGKYTQTLVNKAGCDSTITLNLTINTVNKTVLQTGATLKANATGASYKWLDCNTNKSPITGATAQSFTATKNGNYAVEVTQNACKDTSSCYSVTGLSIANTGFAKGITIYPNPTFGQLHIELNTPLQNGTLKLINLTGQLIIEKANLNGDKFLLDLDAQPSGIYFIEINQNGNSFRTKVVKD